MFETLAPTLAPDSPTSPQDLGGLLGITGEREVAFPLREVRVRATIAGNCCRTIVEQVFDNPYEQALEAVHIFPLPPDAAVTKVELHAGETLVRAECREREEAERAFDEARLSGRRAALLIAERSDVHTLRVTNIPPATAVRVRLVLVQRLEESDGAFNWRFPTVVAPRYLPGSPIHHEGAGVFPDTDAAPDASRLQPPLRLAGGTKLDLEVEIAGPLASIESSLHAVRTSLGDLVRVAPSGLATLDRDFVLRFAPAVSDAAALRVYTDGQFTLAVINPPAAIDAPRVPRDVVLVIDVSGSMSGEKLEAARRAMSAVLHGLEKGDRFRLIAFESQVHAHTADLLPFDQSSLQKADRWIRTLQPMGGTEMLPALQEAFAGKTPHGRLRTVIFITDGQAHNQQQLMAAVDRHRAGALLFTVGIDTAVNESLLRRLANIGHGTCELLTPSDDIEEAIVRLEARFGSPVLTGLAPTGLEPARPETLQVFAGRPVTMLLRGGGAALRFDGTDAGGRPLQLVADAPTTISFPLGALWAREHVAWLDDRITLEPSREAQIRKEIVAVALEHHLASRFTAFVAVEERVSNQGARVTVVQPVELPHAWSRSFVRAQVDTGDTGAFTLASLTGATFACEAMPAAPRADGRSRLRAVTEPLLSRLTAHAAPPPENARTTSPRDLARAIETMLATSQDADGSYGDSVERTAAALVTLVRLGHTRQHGARRRVVQKCARWLAQHADRPMARLALDLLQRVESGGPLPRAAEVIDLLAARPEGEHLAQALDAV
jgi:Ca-activated chloride channel family protein